ncbi:MAG: M17 family peptidase N-terminal domain-containing protein, partial [Rhodothermales bacterium]
MKVSITTLPLSELDVDLLVFPIAEGDVQDRMKFLAEEFGLSGRFAAEDFKGKAEDTLLLYPERSHAKRLGLVGMGALEKLDAERLRRAAALGESLARKCRAETVGIVHPDVSLDPEVASQALVEGFMLAAYRFLKYKTDEKEYPGAARLVLHAGDQEKSSRRGVERGKIVAEAVSTARDLVNLSPDDKTATTLARAIEKIAKRHGFTASVWDK